MNVNELTAERRHDIRYHVRQYFIPEMVECVMDSVAIIPEGTTKIGKFAFMNCHSLERVTIPTSVTEIECHAFHQCTSLKSVTIPESVNEIGYAAFTGPTRRNSTARYTLHLCQSQDGGTVHLSFSFWRI